MFNKLFSAIALIGLMLFSTLGSMAYSPPLSKTGNTESTFKASTGKTAIAFHFDSNFLKPADSWQSPEAERYQKPVDDPKPDNTEINGILNSEDRHRQAKPNRI